MRLMEGLGVVLLAIAFVLGMLVGHWITPNRVEYVRVCSYEPPLYNIEAGALINQNPIQ